MTVLLPKPLAERDRWQKAMAGCGHSLLWVDPWAFEVFEETPEQRHQWLNLDLFAGVICVSPFAARLLVRALDRYWPMPPVGVQWWCNGPGSASELSAAGLQPSFPDQGHTAEAVLNSMGQGSLDEQKWLVVQGEGGRERYPTALGELGASVIVLSLYRRRVDTEALSVLVEQSKNADALLVSSVTLLDAMMEHHSSHWRAWRGQWLYTSGRIQGRAKAWALPPGQQLNGASPQALLAAL